MTSALLWLPVMLAIQTSTPATGRDLSDWLLGNWTGKGALFEQPASMSLSVCPLAGDRGLMLDYQVTGEGSPPIRFAGHADYIPDGQNRWRGRWTGTNGVDHDLTALASYDSFVATWKNAAVETGRTHYERIAPRQLRVTDYVLRDGGRFEQFASADYVRNSACPVLTKKGQ
ncbi:hypothetical protein [Sphingorhabdus sp. EL138]|uniref:hypothetical protein n=1 Tax=Sphingorhabdus sp. EL138 TaxID=2073156 RepID=UPI000D68BAA9|nr:hypothetical protein [Sphingorhabdus sp. EL138]